MKLDSKLKTVFVVVCIVILIIFFAFGLHMVAIGGASLTELAFALGILLIVNALTISILRSEIRDLAISAAKKGLNVSFGAMNSNSESITREDRAHRLSLENKVSNKTAESLKQPRPIRNERVKE